MTKIRSLNFIAVCVSGMALSGCASFNDTLVVDIGDQFDLLKLEVKDGQPVERGWSAKHGFECDFDAHSKRLSWFAGEREVSGSIRCRPLVP